ncbi:MULTISPECIES: AAA family ATPase [unclassified Nitratiruptor]|uniref:AAA family ATPase n=1 Tax=unclassified Nitratiruptor TaxID=2624044 RepID=UPI00191516EE|nr:MULTISPECIES: AAA family ATPase [unclassified Nitratiruptor]BCD59917.1 flagellar biosynthesis protein FlhG [Nitratiruptor sp. YY08-10]BCD63840.1 flagellar biosynthesis protein FlhG [Nitratiruptor sp. YY08-14]
MMDQASGLRELVSKKQKQTRDSNFITIASGKGGVGKTNFALNFSYLMANQYNKRVLLIDADFGMANIHLFVEADAKRNMKNLYNGASLDEVIQKADGFDVLLGFSGIDDIWEIEDTTAQTIVAQLEQVSSRYDYIIIDSGAGIDDKIAGFLRASDRSYIVTTPEPTALMDAYALIKSMYNIYGYDRFKIVVNMSKNREDGKNTYNKLRVSLNKFLQIDAELLGILPYTNSLRQSVRKKMLVCKNFPKDSYTINMRRICESELRIQKTSSENFWQKLFDFMGKSE